MAVSPFVVEHRSALQRVLGSRDADVLLAELRRRSDRQLQRVQRRTRVAFAAHRQELDRLLVHRRCARAPRRERSTVADLLVLKASSAYTRMRESRAPLTSKAGFSVVAPISVTRPSSTAGSSASCWALLKRWISSRKNTVGVPARGAAMGGALEHVAHLGTACLHGAELLEGRL